VRRAAAQMRSAQCAGAGAQLTGTQQPVKRAAEVEIDKKNKGGRSGGSLR